MNCHTPHRKQKLKKLFKQLHLYLSLPFGIIITLICFSGAMLGIEKDIAPSAGQHQLYVEKGEQRPLLLDSLLTLTQSTLPDDVRITSVNIFSDSTRSYQFNLSKPRKSSLYVNPYTGEALGRNQRQAFFQTMFRLHRWLLGPAKADDGSIGWGKLLVGVSTLLFVVILITGIIIWWPRTTQTLRASLKIPFRKGLRPMMHGVHLAGGAYAFILLLIMALTGLTWSFKWYSNGFYALLGGNSTITPPTSTTNPQRERPSKDRKKDFAWQQALENLIHVQPDFAQITLSEHKASIKTDTWGNARATDQYVLNDDGEITSVTPYADTDYSRKLRGWVFTLHTGAFAGAWRRWLWAIVALVGALLPLTGYYLWWKRTRRKHCHPAR